VSCSDLAELFFRIATSPSRYVVQLLQNVVARFFISSTTFVPPTSHKIVDQNSIRTVHLFSKLPAKMVSHSSTFSVQDTTGSGSPMTPTGCEHQLKEARTSPVTTTPGFATPISFVSEHDTSEDLGYSPRKKLRTSSSTDSLHLAQRSDRELNVPNLRSPASILARLDLSHVPKNEFILALPGQVNSSSNWGIEYARPIMRRSNAFLSKGDTGADSSMESLNCLLFNGPTSSGPSRKLTTTRSVFLPILDLDLDEDFSQEDTRNPCGFRLKPRARKLMVHPETRPWDQECAF
jgi:hypothetical protein